MKTLRMFLVYVVFIPVLFLAGCADKRSVVASNGFKDSREAISIPHPKELEKKGEQYIVIFPIILDPGLWGVEGFSHEDLDVGIFPIITDGKPKGYGLITEANFFADRIMHAIVVGRKKDINIVVYLSRDGHLMYDITGDEFEIDSEKFDKDSNYKKQVFSAAGMSIRKIEDFWRKYSEERGLEIPSDFQFVEEIKIGSARWEEFKSQLATRLTQNYTMQNGEIRKGYLSLSDFRVESSKNHGTTAGQRFSRKAVVPATIEPVTFTVGAVGSMLNGLIAASNGPMEGFYTFAECKRGDLKPRFRKMSNDFKELLIIRDQKIYDLQQQILQMGGTP